MYDINRVLLILTCIYQVQKSKGHMLKGLCQMVGSFIFFIFFVFHFSLSPQCLY